MRDDSIDSSIFEALAQEERRRQAARSLLEPIADEHPKEQPKSSPEEELLREMREDRPHHESKYGMGDNHSPGNAYSPQEMQGMRYDNNTSSGNVYRM